MKRNKLVGLPTLIVLFLSAFISTSCNDTTSSEKPDQVFFKVAETDPQHGDSFIIALTDPGDIATSRTIISDPESTSEKIVYAKVTIQQGNESYLNKDLNRDVTWSWRVESFEHFAFNTIEIIDGWPGYVEEDPERWFQNTASSNTHGYIGFWGYTVVEEVNEAELQ